MKVYPNPTQGNLKIDLGTNYSHINAKGFDAKGKLVSQKAFNDVQIFDLEIEGVNGVYFVRLEIENGLKAGIEILKN